VVLEAQGDVAPGFEAVADAFVAAFEDSQGMGAALAIRQHGVPVVDLWAGVADARTGATWTHDTISVIFSCTKGLVSLLMARLVRDGRIAYDDPVARYWPEFAGQGRDAITIGDILSHRAGLSAFRDPVTLDEVLDWPAMIRRLETEEPLWEPGTGHSYHALTHGWLAGEVIRRVTGVSVGQHLRDVLADPLGVDAWIGLPESAESRVAHLRAGADLMRSIDAWLGGKDPAVIDWAERAITLGGVFPPELVVDDGAFNDPRVHRAEVPGAGGIASARALATIWSAAIVPTDGMPPILSASTIELATRTRSDGPQVFAPLPPWARWGMGFQLDSAARRLLTPSAFGHDGAGGQVAFADPQTGIGFAFLTNVLEGDRDRRANRIVDALRQIVGPPR